MTLKVNNHYVPKLYLKQWARNGKISTFRLLVPNERVEEWKDYSLAGIAYHQHLYTYLMGKEETDEFECWLDREFENPAEEPIQRAINGDRMTPEHWRKIIRFAMSLDVRTPARLRDFLRRQNEELPKLIEETLQESVRKLEKMVANENCLHLPEKKVDKLFPVNINIEETADGGRIGAEIIAGRRLWIWQMKHLLTETIKILPQHKWTILHAPDGISWPTSDNPMIRLNYQDEKNYDFKGGWGVVNGDLMLPLSPKHLLITCIGRRPLRRGTVLDMKTAEIIRRIIIQHADRYIFSLDQFEFSDIRGRVISVDYYKNEKMEWENWNKVQLQAESELKF